jgi:hypothetical protein
MLRTSQVKKAMREDPTLKREDLSEANRKALDIQQPQIDARRRQIEQLYARNGLEPPALCTVTCGRYEAPPSMKYTLSKASHL